MLYLLDTTAFSDLMGAHSQLHARLADLPDEDQVIFCTITNGEIGYGLSRLPQGARRESLVSAAARLRAAVVCEGVPPEAGEHYARVKLTREQKGLPLGENDLWITATAMTLGATLVTRDGDFQDIDGLAVEDWGR